MPSREAVIIYSDRHVFLHFPKNAGKSLTRFFIQAWAPSPVRGFISKGQFNDLPDLIDKQRVILQQGKGHENLRISLNIFEESEFETQEPSTVFVCIRNPYDHAVSTYFYQRNNYHRNKMRENFQLAHRCSFRDYWMRLPLYKPASFFQLVHGKTPDFIRFIRFENLGEELQSITEEFSFTPTTLDHLNKGEHNAYRMHYDKELEENIYKRYQYFFDSGLYARESFD